MNKLIILTDIHFTVSRDYGGIDPVARLKSALDHIQQHNSDLDQLVISGDLTHKGDVASYELLRDTLNEYTLSPKLLIGNHDNRENFLSVFPDTNTDSNGFVQSAIDVGQDRLIMLDTLDGPPYDYPLSHRGMLCEKRLSWLDEELANAGKRRCIIVMHHHPHDVGFRAMDTIKLVNGEAFYKTIEAHNNVAHLCCGHVHRTISGSHRGIPFSVFKSTVGQMPMLFDTMDFHAVTNEPAAYGIISLHEHGVTVHTEDYELTDLGSFQ